MGMGHTEGEITPLLGAGLLAATGSEIPKTVLLSANALNADGGTYFDRGTVLVLVTQAAHADFGLYREFDPAATGTGMDDGSTAVILQHPVDVADAIDGKQHCSAYITGVFDREKVIVDAAFDESVVPRLILWPAQ